MRSEPEQNGTAVDSSRRAEMRYPASAVPQIRKIRLSPGDIVGLLNISSSGVLVEGKTRFVPGTRVTVSFDGPVTPKQVKGRVVRCQVSAIATGGSLQYQTGIAFEAKITLPVDDAVEPAPEPAPEPPRKQTTPPAAQLRNRW